MEMFSGTSTSMCFDVCRACVSSNFIGYIAAFCAGAFVGLTADSISLFFEKIAPSLKEDEDSSESSEESSDDESSDEGEELQDFTSPKVIESDEQSLESEDDELTKMFDDEQTRKNRSSEEILDIGRKTGKEPVVYFAGKGGGYMTGEDIQKQKNAHKKYKKLSRADELDIMRTFRNIKGMLIIPAARYLRKEGYKLHILYINDGELNKAFNYDASLLGVKIKDREYDLLRGQLSSSAVIEDIIDVGGQDARGRGKIKI